MKAAVFTRYGSPEVLRISDVAKPAPGDGDVLVQVHATTVCAADWRMRKADPFVVRFMLGFWRPTKFQVLGMEFSGAVESVGKAVKGFRAGDQVFGLCGRTFGAHAEYVCTAEDHVAMKPANMTYEEAAAVAFGGTSALYFLRKAGIQEGQHVLVYGASGSVGVFATQLAKHFGARVTAVCSTANLEMVKSFGADAVVDYTREDFSSAGRVYDLVFDAVGKAGLSRSLRALRRGSAYVSIAPSGGALSMATDTIKTLWVSATGAAKVISPLPIGVKLELPFLKDLIEAGALRTVIEKHYPLEEIAEAHRHAEAGHKKGHVVIRLSTTAT
jgi:NADPH:quinone reductase-like Zn-dependent oxidoreductase